MTLSRAVTALLASVALAGCGQTSSGGGGYDLTDAQVRTFGEELGYARPADAAALARLALERGKDRSYVVLEATDIEAADPDDVSKRIVLRVPSQDEQTSAEPVCYRLSINSYALVGRPDRIGCPAGATPYTPPPAPPEVEIPVGADRLVRQALREGGTAAAVQIRLDKAMADALSGRHAKPPLVRVEDEDGGTGVGVYGGPGKCLLGRSIGGEAEVWYLDPVQAMPGELSCDPPTALAGLGQQSPR